MPIISNDELSRVWIKLNNVQLYWLTIAFADQTHTGAGVDLKTQTTTTAVYKQQHKTRKLARLSSPVSANKNGCTISQLHPLKCNHSSWIFITRQHFAYRSRYCFNNFCLSVSPSVCLMPVLCLNEWTCISSFFWYSCRAVILVFRPHRRTEFQGEPLSGALNTRGGKILQISPFIPLLWNTNRKS